MNVVLVSDAIAQAEQVRMAAAGDSIAIVYQSNNMTVMGLVDLLVSESAAHDSAPIEHVGIVAHGGPGKIDLGKDDKLSSATIPSQAAAFERLRSVLTNDARLDLYACSVAAGAGGKTFVDELAAVTGAAVFASDNPVGTVPGSDLIWEYHTGDTVSNNDLFSVHELETITNLSLPTPAVATQAASAVGSTSATLNAQISSTGGATITERRFSWGTTASCSDGWTNAVTVNVNNFSYTLSGLTPGQTYYFQAWADNSAGWSTGSALSFTLSGGDQPDYPGASWVGGVPTGNYTAASRIASDIRWIVVHTTESTADSAIQWFQNPSSGVSAHYIVKRDGSIVQLVRDHDIAWHAGNWSYNQQSIGIEHERYAGAEVTPAQYAASARLTQWLASQYDANVVFPTGVEPADPAAAVGVIGHNQVPDPSNPSLGGGASHHTDPTNWDWNYYKSLFEANGNDNFASRTDLGSVASVTVSGSNVGFTGETGELSQSGAINSAWWSWTAPSSGTLTVDTNGSGFDTYLTLATGSAVGSLTALSQNDDGGSNLCSLITWTVNSGTQYQIAVDGYGTNTGSIVLHVSLVPTGDTVPPVVSSLSPTDNASGVSPTTSLVLTFNEAIQKGTGNIVVKKTSDNSVVETIGVGSTAVTVSGTTATIVRSVTLAQNTGYYVTPSAGSFKDLAGNDYAGISDATSWNFTTSVGSNDNFANRTDLGSAVSVTVSGSNVGYTGEMGELPQNGTINSAWWSWTAPSTGMLTIDTNGSGFDTHLTLATGSAVGSLTMLSQNDNGGSGYCSLITGAVVSGTQYQIAVDGFQDHTGDITLHLSFVNGISPLGVDSLSPADNATGVHTSTNFMMTFNQAIKKGTGNIAIKKASDNSTVETIPVSNGSVVISGTTAIVFPTVALSFNTEYYVEVQAGAFQDLAGNAFAGISGATSWNFTVEAGFNLVGSLLTLGINDNGSLLHGPTQAQYRGVEFFYPGTPYHEFSVSADGTRSMNAAGVMAYTIPGATTDVSTGTTLAARFTGTVSGLSLVRDVWFDRTSSLVNASIQLTNTSGSSINNVAFLEAADPDQGYPDFKTKNDVVTINGAKFVRATSTGANPGYTVGFGSEDPRAVVSVNNPWPFSDPFTILNSPTDPDGAVDDAAVGIAFNFGTLAPGQSVRATYVFPFTSTPEEADALFASTVEPPTVNSLSPPDNATDVSAGANLVITFSKNVQKGSGNILLKRSSDNSVVETIAVSSAAVTISGATATIDPAITLAGSAGYYVEVAAGVFEDLAGNDFAGISGATAWCFTTNAPTLTLNVVAAAVAENAGAAATTVTISRNTDTTAALVVNLSSSDASEATVPATATIAVGQSSVTVNLAAVDDSIVDGTQTVTITASATGFTNGSDTLQVTDN
ncbi:MAG: Ig-like domain-containing protein, partial [Planctomycetota bacterium]|nr:Ig-like domain-containing protein [Planctomycetota bacterium]